MLLALYRQVLLSRIVRKGSSGTPEEPVSIVTVLAKVKQSIRQTKKMTKLSEYL